MANPHVIIIVFCWVARLLHLHIIYDIFPSKWSAFHHNTTTSPFQNRNPTRIPLYSQCAKNGEIVDVMKCTNYFWVTTCCWFSIINRYFLVAKTGISMGAIQHPKLRKGMTFAFWVPYGHAILQPTSMIFWPWGAWGHGNWKHRLFGGCPTELEGKYDFWMS